ncbi:MAG: YggS family pyridoxal phosphate-dependent enzyme [Phycisphaerales bacterium]
MPTVETLESRYAQVKDRLGNAATKSGRKVSDILLVAVTKYADMQQVRELVELGHPDLGESRVQQLVQRAAQVEELLDRRRTMPGVSAAARSGFAGGSGGVGGERGQGVFDFSAVRSTRHQPGSGPTPADAPGPLSGLVRWHLIGHLQRNKVKKSVDVVRLIHSVDSLRLIEEIQAAAYKRDRVVDVLVQINCSGEGQKFGCAIPAAWHLCEQIDSMIHLRVRGVMCMAPYSDNPEDSRPVFQRCREIFEDLQRRGAGGGGGKNAGHFNILSMGMSNDFEVAVECGANLVRVGSALFGEAQVESQDVDEAEEE